jgi:hypothetical protein
LSGRRHSSYVDKYHKIILRYSHPVTYKNGTLAFKGNNHDRYLMGCQFMVLMVVFVVNQCGQPLDPKVNVLGMPNGVKFVFFDIGLGMIVFTCVFGQLWSQAIVTCDTLYD